MTDAPKFGFLCAGKNPLDLSVSVHCSYKLSGLFRNFGFMPGGCYTEIINLQDTKLSLEKTVRTLEHLCISNDLVMTIGNTGFSPYDIIPDVTDAVCKKKVSYFTNILCGSAEIPAKNSFLNKKDIQNLQIYPDIIQNPVNMDKIMTTGERASFSAKLEDALNKFSSKLVNSHDKLNLDGPQYTSPSVMKILYSRKSFKTRDFPENTNCISAENEIFRLHPSRACSGIYNKTLVLNMPANAKNACTVATAVMSALWVIVYNISGKSAAFSFDYEKTLKSLPEFQEIINKKDIVNI